MQHIPREDRRDERSGDTDQRRGAEPHWVRTRQQQAGERTDEQADEQRNY
jgi:hypothetical protein